jgi:hypothetical protein
VLSALPPIARLLLEALDEPLEHADPDLVLADLVLDAVLEIGIVVDLHDDEAAVGLLDVDAVEPLPDLRPLSGHLLGARTDAEPGSSGHRAATMPRVLRLVRLVPHLGCPRLDCDNLT